MHFQIQIPARSQIPKWKPSMLAEPYAGNFVYFVLRIWGCQNIKKRPNQIWRNVYSDLICLESGLYRSWHSPNISCCRMSVSLAVFAGNSDSEASRDIFGRARAPEFGSFLWHHFVHQFWGFNFFPFLFPLKWYNWKTSILRSSRSQTIKAETPVELDSAILKLYKGGLCSGTRICKTKPNQSARWLSQARPWAESEQSLPLLAAPCKATARCAARSYEHLHWGQRETDPRITMLTSFNISFQNTDSFSLPPPPFRCHPWKLVLARVHVRMKDFHPKTPRRFTLYHPWPLADSKQIEGLPPKMMCFTSHSLQSEGILNHLRRPYRYKTHQYDGHAMLSNSKNELSVASLFHIMEGTLFARSSHPEDPMESGISLT